ncbi:MAG: hypothetical protein PHG00_13245 [Methylococcales bacterium]|nr:hypothetical protein [Methylococcales bacterium]
MARAETVAKGHGRIEVRQCRLSTDIAWLRERPPECKNLNSISAIDSECHLGATVTQEIRYFTGSSLTSATQMLAAVVCMGVSKTSCMGYWTCLSGRIKVAYAKTTLSPMLLLFVMPP